MARILVVEDNVMAQMMACNVLKDLGFEVDGALTGEKTMELIKKHNYIFVFMDLGLPDTDGFELTKKLREYGLTVPVVALTAHNDDAKRKQAKISGLNDFFVKPLTEEKAKEILEKNNLL